MGTTKPVRTLLLIEEATRRRRESDSDGLIEKYRENLLVQSNQFDTTWSNVNTTETGGQSGYDGSSNDAWLIEQSNGCNWSLVVFKQGIFLRCSVGVHTFSVYLKAKATSNWVHCCRADYSTGNFAESQAYILIYRQAVR